MSPKKIRASRGAIVILVLVACFCVLTFFDTIHREHVGPCTVTAVNGKHTVDDSEDGEDLVATKQCGTLRVGNTLVGGSIGAEQLFRDIKVGHSYIFTTQGFVVKAVHGHSNIIHLLEIHL